MAENKTKVEDLNENTTSGELSENEAAQVSGGQEHSQRLPRIDTVHGDNSVELSISEVLSPTLKGLNKDPK